MSIKDSFDSFFKKWNGKVADFDGYYGGQCYDLAQFWTKEIGGHLFVGLYAKDIYSQPKDFYIQIPNTPEAVPQVGDIVVWAGTFNSYKDKNGKLVAGPGHVAIATGNGDTKAFEVFSQNDPTGAKCILKTYKYDHVIGWLRKKEDECQKKIDELNEQLIEMKRQRDEKDRKYEECKTEKARIEQEKNQHIESLQGSLALANESATKDKKELTEVRAERDRLLESNKELTESNTKLLEDVTTLNEDKKRLQGNIEALEGKLSQGLRGYRKWDLLLALFNIF